MTASATAPPALHNTVSRRPRIHRAGLELHMNREYAQKPKLVTTHFFGFFYYRYQDFTRACQTTACSGDIALAIGPTAL